MDKILKYQLVSKDEMEMWKRFLLLLSSFSSKGLTDREADIVSYVMSKPSSVEEPLRGVSRKNLKSLLNMKEQTLSMHKSNIEEKGFLVEGKLPQTLKSFKESYLKDSSLTISFKFILDEKH